MGEQINREHAIIAHPPCKCKMKFQHPFYTLSKVSFWLFPLIRLHVSLHKTSTSVKQMKNMFWWSLFFHYFQCIIRPTASASLPPSLVLLPLIETGVHLIKAALRGPGLRYVFPPTENSLVSHPVCFLCFYEGYTYICICFGFCSSQNNKPCVSAFILLSCDIREQWEFRSFCCCRQVSALSGCWVANCKRRS